MHSLLSTVEWATPEADGAMVTRFAALIPRPEEWQAAALQTARECLQHPALAEVFCNPGGGAVLWRERAFEAMLGGECVSGVFDRVILTPGEARLIEFKTDEVQTSEEAAALAATYSRQLLVYRDALVKLTGLLPEQIRIMAVFTAVPCLVRPVL